MNSASHHRSHALSRVLTHVLSRKLSRIFASEARSLFAGFAMLIGALLLLFACSIYWGAADFQAAQLATPSPEHAVLPSLPGLLHLDALIYQLRWQRSLGALLVGASLGVAGVLMQNLTRNPLAEPGLLGVNSGAALGLVVAIAFFQVETGFSYLLAAFAGALLGNLGVLLIARHAAHAKLSAASAAGGSALAAHGPLHLLLAGLALGASFHGISSAILFQQAEAYDQYRFWVLGSLAAINLPMLQMAGPPVLFGVFLALVLARPLSALSLGDEQASLLGYRPGVLRTALVLACTLLTASAVALAGPVAFLGLLAPFLARSAYAWLLPSARASCQAERSVAGVQAAMHWQILLAAGFGALLLLAADLAGRLIAAPFETPLSVMTACLGAPLMMYLVKQDAKQGRMLGGAS